METWQVQSCGLARKSGSLHMGVRGIGRAAEKEEGREAVGRFCGARMAPNPQPGTWCLPSPGLTQLGLGASTPSGSDRTVNAGRRPSPLRRVARQRWLSATQLWLSNKQLTPPSVTTSTVREAGVPGNAVAGMGPCQRQPSWDTDAQPGQAVQGLRLSGPSEKSGIY